MKDKKNAVITFRTEEWIKEKLIIAAEQNKWSLAQTVEELCKKFIACPQPEHIIIRTQDLINAVEEIKKEGTKGAVELLITLQPNEDETNAEKILIYNVLENGGFGCTTGFDPIVEMTKEEILDIP